MFLPACRDGDFLLDHGVDPNGAATHALRVAPLHWATAAGVGELVALLLDRGANPNAGEAGGLTPFYMLVRPAIGRSSRDCCKRRGSRCEVE